MHFICTMLGTLLQKKKPEKLDGKKNSGILLDKNHHQIFGNLNRIFRVLYSYNSFCFLLFDEIAEHNFILWVYQVDGLLKKIKIFVFQSKHT